MTEIDWRALAEVFDYYASEDRAPVLHAFYFWIVDHLDRWESDPERFVELGCGTGQLAAKLVEWYPNSRFDLVDKDSHMLRAARERFSDEPEVRIHEVTGESFLESLDHESIDVVVSCRSFYALQNSQAVAAALMRVLKPEGSLFIYDFLEPIDLGRLEATDAPQDAQRFPVLRAAIREFNAGLEAGTYRVYTEAELRALFEAAGGEVIDYECLKPAASTHQLCVHRR